MKQQQKLGKIEHLSSRCCINVQRPPPQLTRHDFADVGPALTYGFSRDARRGCAPPPPPTRRMQTRLPQPWKEEKRAESLYSRGRGGGVGKTL